MLFELNGLLIYMLIEQLDEGHSGKTSCFFLFRCVKISKIRTTNASTGWFDECLTKGYMNRKSTNNLDFSDHGSNRTICDESTFSADHRSHRRPISLCIIVSRHQIGMRSEYEHSECLTHNWSMYQDQSAQLALLTLVKLVPSIDSSYRFG